MKLVFLFSFWICVHVTVNLFTINKAQGDDESDSEKEVTTFGGIPVPFLFQPLFIGRAAVWGLEKIFKENIPVDFFNPTPDEKQLQEFVSDTEFPCNVKGFRSLKRPNSVHELKPGDIDCIAALGDSITAGYSVFSNSIYTAWVSNRGVSFSIGGEANWRKYLTLPNILKKFNPNIIGYAIDNSTVKDASGFNLAKVGIVSFDLLSQIMKLEEHMKNDERVRFKEDWKLITLFIGHNDLCSLSCHEPRHLTSANVYQKKLREGLDYLRDNFPRTLVNLLPPADVTAVFPFLKEYKECESYLAFYCPCLFDKENWNTQNLKDLWLEYVRVAGDLVESNRYNTMDDFTVVIQPLMENLPKMKLSDVSLDCFHPRQNTHAKAANLLWNNMLEPESVKSLEWREPFIRFLCPSEEVPFIFTHKNSLTFLETGTQIIQ